MSYDRLLATGNGKLGARLFIEGFPYQMVTDASMEQSGAWPRIMGLQMDGLSWSDSIEMPFAELEASGSAVTVVDRQRDAIWTQAFTWRPQRIAYLAADITDSDSTITVDSTAGFAADDFIHIGTEAIRIGAIGSGTTFTGCLRSQLGSRATYHYAADGDRIGETPIYKDRPLTLEGRRAYLYLYGEGDNPQGDGGNGGNPVRRFVVRTEPRLGSDSATYTMTLASIYDRLKADFGADLGVPVSPRGIYYSASNPLVLTVSEFAAATGGGRPFGYPSPEYAYINGFFETNEDLVTEINTRLSAAPFTSFNNTYEAVERAGSIAIKVTIDATTPRYPVVSIASECDEVMGNAASDGGGQTLFDEQFGSSLLSAADTVSASEVYYAWPGRDGGHPVPRGTFGELRVDTFPSRARTFATYTPDDNTHPDRRIYVGGAISVGALEAASLTFFGGPNAEDGEYRVRIGAQNAVERSVDLGLTFGQTTGSGPASFLYGLWGYVRAVNQQIAPPAISFTRLYVENGSLADFLAALDNDTPVEAPRGNQPGVLIGIDTGTWSVLSTVEQAAFQIARTYIAVEGRKLVEVLQEEWKLRGVFPILNSDGLIDLARIRIPSPAEATNVTLDANDILIDQGFPTWERGAKGAIHTVLLRTRYDFEEDDHAGAIYVVDQGARSEKPLGNTVEVKPFTRAVANGDATAAQALEVMRPLLGIYGQDYAVVRVRVPFKYFEVQLGDAITCNIPNIPDIQTGRRGVENAIGLVIGREWDLKSGTGALEIIIFGSRVAGYAPSAYVSSESGTGDAWTLTLSTTLFGVPLFPAGDVIADHFQVGDKVRVIEWDDPTPTVLTGEITQVSGSDVDVTFDAAWVPGASDWVLEFDVAATVQSRQEAYAFYAGTDNQLTFPGGTVPAQVLSP